MVQIVYEYTDPWPQQGVLQLKSPLTSLEIAVSPDSARRKVNGYLALHVSMSLLAGKPVLLMNQPPVWQVPLEMKVEDSGPIATFGTVEVDAQTRELVPLTPLQIRTIQDQVNELLARLTSDATATS